MVPFYKPFTTFYWSAIITMALSCIILEIERDIGQNHDFFHSPCIRHPR